MLEFNHITPLQDQLNALRAEGKTIGFVPTMGALHDGHLSLVRKAAEQCDITVASIFVNPTQFNEGADFSHYPRDPQGDAEKLKSVSCSILFRPEVDEVYPEKDDHQYRFGRLDELMEGANRPGHFNGVGMVVKRLFEIVQPHRAFFGEKDYQQLLVIRRLNEIYQLGVEVIGCPIIRESNGLAMSSRNQRMSSQEAEQALALPKALMNCRSDWGKYDVDQLQKRAWNALLEAEGVAPEYFEIADADSLEPLEKISESQSVRAFVAAQVGPVRLIDNLQIFP